MCIYRRVLAQATAFNVFNIPYASILYVPPHHICSISLVGQMDEDCMDKDCISSKVLANTPKRNKCYYSDSKPTHLIIEQTLLCIRA